MDNNEIIKNIVKLETQRDEIERKLLKMENYTKDIENHNQRIKYLEDNSKLLNEKIEDLIKEVKGDMKEIKNSIDLFIQERSKVQGFIKASLMYGSILAFFVTMIVKYLKP